MVFRVTVNVLPLSTSLFFPFFWIKDVATSPLWTAFGSCVFPIVCTLLRQLWQDSRRSITRTFAQMLHMAKDLLSVRCIV